MFFKYKTYNRIYDLKQVKKRLKNLNTITSYNYIIYSVKIII